MKAGALMKKAKAHLKTLGPPERGGLEVQPVAISIDGQIADKIAKAGNIGLDLTQTARLQDWLRLYAQYFQVDVAQRSSRKVNKQLDSLLKDLNELIATLDLINLGTLRMNEDFKFDDRFSVAGQIIFREASVLPRRFKRELAALHAACKEMRSSNSQSGPRRNYYLLPLMNSLAALYREAGGTSTGVHRGESKTRRSPFVDFAWTAMLLLPKKMRHSSKKALASWWDENDPRAKREKPPKGR